MLEMSTESVGSSASCLQPRRLLFQEKDPAQNLQTTPDQMYNPFSSPPQQEGHVRNTVSDSVAPGSVSAASDRPITPTPIPQNAPGVATSLSFSPWLDGNFGVNRHPSQPTHSQISQNTPEVVKAPCTPEAYTGNKGLKSGVGGSGPSDRQALVKLMMDGEELPELLCPCGKGPCIVRTSGTKKNPNRRFYKCEECNFFKWCDELGQNSRSPLKPSQGYTRSPGKITKPQNTPLEPDKPTCSCKAGPCIVQTMHEGENKGRKYYACPIKKGQGACTHFVWVDNPMKTPETENNSKAKQNNLLIADVTTPEPEQWVGNPMKPPETENNGNQNTLFISNMTSSEPKQTLSPYESVKDLFGEHDMGTVEFWRKGQNDQNDSDSAAAIAYEMSKKLSPSKRQRQPSTEGQPSAIGEISPMKRLNLNDASPVVENCRMCGEPGQCIECPILTCFREDDFAENKHETVVDGGSISNLANISPIGGTAVLNVNPSGLKRSGKCFNCGKEGHWRSECTLPRGANSVCFKCGKVGHWMKDCNM